MNLEEFVRAWKATIGITGESRLYLEFGEIPQGLTPAGEKPQRLAPADNAILAFKSEEEAGGHAHDNLFSKGGGGKPQARPLDTMKQKRDVLELAQKNQGAIFVRAYFDYQARLFDIRDVIRELDRIIKEEHA
jgi:hypothetical protein